MHYKRYCRPTVREALRAVKEELGPSALVLSTRKVRAPGLRGLMGGVVVEVTAAAARPEVSEERISRTAGRLDLRIKNMAARLTASGLDAPIAERVARHPALQQRGAGTAAMRQALADTLAAAAATDNDFAPVEVFIGPPGVGKTTTIAKIAAQARATQAMRVGLVAADAFRVGAIEQLRLYADIIGSPFATARSGGELAAAIDGGRRPLLVDTAGRSPRDAASAEILDVLAGREGVRRHLVLPATTTPAQARRILERFDTARPDRLVLTRLDEADTIAPLVGVLTECGLPISYLANGQNVPDDLQRATPAALAGWVLGEAAMGACA